MQGNDLGSYWSVKFIVLAEPTIFERPEDTYRVPIRGKGIGKKEITGKDYRINQLMVAWIVNVGRQRNIPTEIWTFNQDEELVNSLATRLDRLASNCVVGWQQWADEEEATLEMRVDPAIHTVYDADPDRVERLWGMRGHRVLRGAAPSS